MPQIWEDVRLPTERGAVAARIRDTWGAALALKDRQARQNLLSGSGRSEQRGLTRQSRQPRRSQARHAALHTNARSALLVATASRGGHHVALYLLGPVKPR